MGVLPVRRAVPLSSLMPRLLWHSCLIETLLAC
jgi:hypothetical protein